MRKRWIHAIIMRVLLVCILWGTSACAVSINPPKLRPSPYFGCISGLKFADVNDLEPHHYDASFWDQYPLVYTAKAGYIDIGHLREAADRARYVIEVCYENIEKKNTVFSYELVEPDTYEVTLKYPDDWDQLEADQKQTIARDVSIELGQRYAQYSLIWHECITWFGYASAGFLSEKPSSFSWEDTYSDLLGTKLGAMAVRDETQSYDEAMTQIISRELKKLEPQPVAVAQEATNLISGKWFSGRYPFVKMNKRNFDVGFDDGAISPFRVPGICEDAVEEPCQVPSLEAVTQYGFTVHLKMIPKVDERKDIFETIFPNDGTLDPEKHFPRIVERVRRLAIKETGKDTDKPTL